jgi:hypothetical protein
MLAAYLDDVALMLGRLSGKGKGSNSPFPYDPANPSLLTSATRSSATQHRAATTMKKLGYGHFYDLEKGGARKFGAGMAENELIRRGKGYGGAIFGRPVKGLGQAAEHLKGSFGPVGIFGTAAYGALTAYSAPRGHKMSGLVKGLASGVAFAVGDAVGTALGGPVAGFMLGSAFEPLGSKIGDGLQMFTDFAHSIRHVNMGGNYEDSKVAYTMRQRGAQEMGSSVMNARSWLGKESALLHQ